jgi:dihydrofolate reductase
MIISCIVAISDNNVIGFNNEIPWYLPADLQYFKKTTLNHHVLMGRNCFESIGKPLPKRTNIIITKDPFFISTNCIICHSIEEGLGVAFDNGEDELFIIGGGKIYEQTQDLWDKLYLTKVDLKTNGDVYFPYIDINEWQITSTEYHKKDEKNEFNYSFETYIRKINQE